VKRDATETFFGLYRFMWLWVVLLGLAILGGVYLYNQPIGGRNGGTTLGLTYGAIATAGMAYLMWYGVRKRYSYASGTGTLKGWLAAHVWIGVALGVLVPLHSGFHIGWNVHAAPYLLMLATIASGIWGAYAYVSMPARMEARREGLSLRRCATEIEVIAQSMAALASGKSGAFSELAARVTVPFRPSLARILFQEVYVLSDEELSSLLATLPKDEYQEGLELTRMAARRLHLCNTAIAEASALARMRIWLYFHLPMSFACVAAVLAHVFWALSFRSSVR
jgi:hypothetical protein